MYCTARREQAGNDVIRMLVWNATKQTTKASLDMFRETRVGVRKSNYREGLKYCAEHNKLIPPLVQVNLAFRMWRM